MSYTQEDLQRLFEENTRSLVGDLSSNAVLCSIRILDPDGNLLVSAARFSSENSPDMPEMEDVIPVEGTVGGDAVRTGKIQEVPDLAKDHRFSNQKILNAGYTSMMAVPILFNGEAKGVAQIYSKTNGYVFSKKEKQMATTIANNMAAVLVCKEYAEEVERLQKKAIEAEKFRLIGEHAGEVTHVLKNRTSIIGGFAYRIKKLALRGSLTKEQLSLAETYADVILEENDKILRQFKHILIVGEKQPKLQMVDIGALLSGVLGAFPSETKEGKKIKFSRDFKANANVMIDEEQIMGVVHELLQNASDAASQCSDDIVIVCRTSLYDRKGHHSICVEVENNGEISREILERVFDPFFTTKKDRGSGLGLFYAKTTVVDRHKGQIVIKPHNGKTTVRFYLPR